MSCWVGRPGQWVAASAAAGSDESGIGGTLPAAARGAADTTAVAVRAAEAAAWARRRR